MRLGGDVAPSTSRAMALGLSRRSSALALQPGRVSLAMQGGSSESPFKLSLRRVARWERAGQLASNRTCRLGRSNPWPEPGSCRVEEQFPAAGAAAAPPGGAPVGALLPGAPPTTHATAASPGRQQQPAQRMPRMSVAGGVLSRLSVGIVDALQWLRIKSNAEAEGHCTGGEVSAQQAVAGALSSCFHKGRRSWQPAPCACVTPRKCPSLRSQAMLGEVCLRPSQCRLLETAAQSTAPTELLAWPAAALLCWNMGWPQSCSRSCALRLSPVLPCLRRRWLLCRSCW